jgi:hypothetical protein
LGTIFEVYLNSSEYEIPTHINFILREKSRRIKRYEIATLQFRSKEYSSKDNNKIKKRES